METAIEERIIKLRRSTLPLFEKFTTNQQACLKKFNTSKRMRALQSEIRVVYGAIVLLGLITGYLSFLEKDLSNVQGFLLLAIISLLLLKNDIQRRIILLEEAKFLKRIAKKSNLDLI
ncbi:MAG: hypothetical protein ACI9GZ_002773 [Bacteroidia bacterium]|jgi:hypothetical protein